MPPDNGEWRVRRMSRWSLWMMALLAVGVGRGAAVDSGIGVPPERQSRTREEVLSLIGTAGTVKPDWWDSVPRILDPGAALPQGQRLIRTFVGPTRRQSAEALWKASKFSTTRAKILAGIGPSHSRG